MENDNEVKYAGFWVRLLAFIVDIFVVSFLMSVMSKIGSMEKFPIIVILILWLYFTISINRWGTTTGGKFLGIRIYTEEMNNLSFLKASVRVIVSIMPFVLYQYLRGMQHMMSPAPSPEVQMLPQLIFILLPFIMFFTKKRQMLHDIVAKCIVIDVNKKVQVDDISPNKILYRGRMVIRIIGVVLFLIVGGYVLLYTSVFYMLGKQSSNSYNNSFHIKYETKDYNNTKIIFYKKELELYSKEFIEAEGMYEIFESDVKKDLALGCIRYFIKREGSDNWLDEGATHRVSARNMYANTEDKIKKAKKKSDYMGHHFYTFDLNMVNHIEDEITQVWSDKNDSICENKLPANELYEIFIKKYIPKFDDENIHSRFGSKPQQREIDWFNILKEKRNDIFMQITLVKEIRAKEEKKNYAEWMAKKAEKKEKRNKRKLEKKLHKQLLKKKLKREKKEKDQKKYDSDVKRGVPPIFAAIQNNLHKKLTELLNNGIDVNKKYKEVIPLMFAIYQNDDKLVEILLKHGATPNVIDKHGLYSPLSKACVMNRISTARLLLDSGADVNYQYNKSETALTVAIKKCTNFKLVKLLLDNGANSRLIDRYGGDTFRTLKIFCHKDNEYNKMKKFIEDNENIQYKFIKFPKK